MSSLTENSLEVISHYESWISRLFKLSWRTRTLSRRDGIVFAGALIKAISGQGDRISGLDNWDFSEPAEPAESVTGFKEVENLLDKGANLVGDVSDLWNYHFR